MATRSKVYYNGLDGSVARGCSCLPSPDSSIQRDRASVERPHRPLSVPHGLVAGAFILASLERVFNVVAVRADRTPGAAHGPGVLIVAPLPLQMHPAIPNARSRCTSRPIPNRRWRCSLRVSLVPDGRPRPRDLVRLPEGPGPDLAGEHGMKRTIYGVLTLWSDDISPEALRIDERIGRTITIVGIPSAFLLTGTSGSSSARSRPIPGGRRPSCRSSSSFPPWCLASRRSCCCTWRCRGSGAVRVDMLCLDTIARYLFYAFIIDFSLEMLDLIHRIYEAGDSFGALDFMVRTRSFTRTS